METNESLTEKLKFIGLNLENVPDKMSFFGNINFKIHKNYNEKNYKVYKYIDVNDIDIFLTPTHRLTDYTEKCAKALPLGAYLSVETQIDIERNIEFLKLVEDLQIDEIKALEDEQKQLERHVPYNIKFNKDYLWQIHYSEVSKRYFMLVPINESECTALFYIIKEQLKNKNTKIFVPICYSEYSYKFLRLPEIEEIEKFLCFFAKEWPLIYEVYNQNDIMSLEITGKAIIFDTLKSEYKIELNNQGEAENYYKLLKALFILETQLSNYYKFNLELDKKGKIHFYYEKKEINFDNLISFIKEEYIKGLEKLIVTKETKINLQSKLKTLKALVKKLDYEYFEKEKQISTFLECKKTFLRKI